MALTPEEQARLEALEAKYGSGISQGNEAPSSLDAIPSKRSNLVDMATYAKTGFVPNAPDEMADLNASVPNVQNAMITGTRMGGALLGAPLGPLAATAGEELAKQLNQKVFGLEEPQEVLGWDGSAVDFGARYAANKVLPYVGGKIYDKFFPKPAADEATQAALRLAKNKGTYLGDTTYPNMSNESVVKAANNEIRNATSNVDRAIGAELGVGAESTAQGRGMAVRSNNEMATLRNSGLFEKSRNVPELKANTEMFTTKAAEDRAGLVNTITQKLFPSGEVPSPGYFPYQPAKGITTAQEVAETIKADVGEEIAQRYMTEATTPQAAAREATHSAELKKIGNASPRDLMMKIEDLNLARRQAEEFVNSNYAKGELGDVVVTKQAEGSLEGIIDVQNALRKRLNFILDSTEDVHGLPGASAQFDKLSEQYGAGKTLQDLIAKYEFDTKKGLATRSSAQLVQTNPNQALPTSVGGAVTGGAQAIANKIAAPVVNEQALAARTMATNRDVSALKNITDIMYLNSVGALPRNVETILNSPVMLNALTSLTRIPPTQFVSLPKRQQEEIMGQVALANPQAFAPNADKINTMGGRIIDPMSQDIHTQNALGLPTAERARVMGAIYDGKRYEPINGTIAPPAPKPPAYGPTLDTLTEATRSIPRASQVPQQDYSYDQSGNGMIDKLKAITPLRNADVIH